MVYQKIKGTNDFYQELALKKAYIEDVSRNVCYTYNIEEIVTPIFEATEVFVRSSGDGSDIVNKEMYSFKDKGENNITLRPEGTASVVRCLLENKLYATPGIKKYFYYGPMFRYERPQRGRYREFHQFGIEYFGENSYYLDCEVIMLADTIFTKLGLKGKYRICVNTIGDFASRVNYQKALKDYFSQHINCLCDDCKRRFEKNPMRILDCKIDRESNILKEAPKIKDYLTTEAVDYFNNLCQLLELFGCDYYIDHNLVRGLDYYTDTVFEFIIKGDEKEESFKGLTMCAGGKYADLVRNFGGPDTPGIGFAFGLERVIDLIDYLGLYPQHLKNSVDIVLISLDEGSKTLCLKIARELREAGVIVELDYKNNNLKPQFKLAERVKAKYVGIIGENERMENMITVKNNNKDIISVSETIKISELYNYLKR